MVVIFVVQDMLRWHVFTSFTQRLSGIKEKGRVFYDRKLRRKMRKLTIYIARHRHSTDYSAHSEPCAHCTKEIKRFGIKKIVYVNANGEINKRLADKYETNYICPGYKEYAKQNIKVD